MLILNTILLVCVIFSGGYIFNIHRRLEMYRQNNIYLHYLLKYVPLGFYFKNLDGTILLANKEFADMVDTDFSSIVGKNYKEELEIVKKYEPKLYKAVTNLFKDSYEYMNKYKGE